MCVLNTLLPRAVAPCCRSRAVSFLTQYVVLILRGIHRSKDSLVFLGGPRLHLGCTLHVHGSPSALAWQVLQHKPPGWDYGADGFISLWFYQIFLTNGHGASPWRVPVSPQPHRLLLLPRFPTFASLWGGKWCRDSTHIHPLTGTSGNFFARAPQPSGLPFCALP